MEKNIFLKKVFVLLFVLMSGLSDTLGDSIKLRNMALALDPNDVGISQENYNNPVWGIVMDTGLSDGYFTLLTLAEGTTSIYYSGGGGIIGGGTYANVRKASNNLLLDARNFYKQGEKVNKFPVPSNGEVIFYFLTFDGVYLYKEVESELQELDNPFFGIFLSAQTVIYELRIVDKRNKQ